MRIVQIANFYGPKSGGIKTAMINLAKEYAALGHEVVHIVPGKTYKQSSAEFGTIYTIPSFLIPFSGGYRMILGVKNLNSTLSGIRPNLIELHDRTSLLSVASWAKKRRIPVVIFAHEILANVLKNFFPRFPFLGQLINIWNKKTEKLADVVVCTTDFAAQEFREINSKKILKIPLGVDLTVFTPLQRSELVRSSYAPDGILMVLASRLSKEKNPEFAFRLLEHMIKKEINVYLLVLGSGPLQKKLQKKYYNLPVTFKGYVSSRNEMAILLAAGDVLLAPGANETFCLAALEAMACGTPVIANEESALKEVILFNGGAVAPLSFQKWETFAKKLSSETQSRVDARNHAIRFTWQRSAELLLESYNDTLILRETYV